MLRALMFCLTLLLLTGCTLLGLQSLQVTSVALSVQRPSNVAVYLWAANGEQPLVDLTESCFRIYENEQLLDPSEVGLTLLERSVAAEHHTVLLLDMSSDSDTARQSIALGATGFVRQVRRSQGVTVYAFDGSPQLTLVGEYPKRDASGATSTPPTLQLPRPRDKSRDLHGAVLEGLKQLDARLMRVQKPVRVGTLAIFARGPDLAARVAPEQVQTALYDTKHQVFTLGFEGPEGEALAALPNTAQVQAQSLDTVAIGFEELASRVDAALRRHYLLAYCSPSRSGQRALRIEVSIIDKDGHELTGDVRLEFDATGFGPGCDPRATPRFVLQSPTPNEGSTPGAAGVQVGEPRAESETAAPAGPEATTPGSDDAVAPPPAKPGYAPE